MTGQADDNVWRWTPSGLWWLKSGFPGVLRGFLAETSD
jgi:hypothetical protein